MSRNSRTRVFATAGAVAVGVAINLVTVSVAQADPLGKTTLEETIGYVDRGGYKRAIARPGESHVLRQELGRAGLNRASNRRSLAFFGQLSDPQIADVRSPARFDYLDGFPGLEKAHRPQEAMGTQVFDQMVRNLNATRTSRITQAGGARQTREFVITTGDNIDNMQWNEASWYVSTLDGGRVDPFSGKPISPSNPCDRVTDFLLGSRGRARLNDIAIQRRYTGVQDYSDYPGKPSWVYDGFYDPDRAPSGGAYRAFPRYPGLMSRSQNPFQAAGLIGQWFTTRGNHDGMVVGNVWGKSSFQKIATGCTKFLPSATVSGVGRILGGETVDWMSLLRAAPSMMTNLNVANTPPDQDRRLLSKSEYKSMHGREDGGHGYGFVEPSELVASNGDAMYYSWSPRPDLRMISIDTIAEGGLHTGNIDDPQYRWLERTVARYCEGRTVCVVFGHHGLDAISNSIPDEIAGSCGSGSGAGCDKDPRKSMPLHKGEKGPESLLALFHKYPNLVAFVHGHDHNNSLKPRIEGSRGFWEIGTASEIDWPQQSRDIELMDNCDGTLSLFTTMIDQAAPHATPPSGTPAGAVSDSGIASVARELGLNDPHYLDTTNGGGVGTRADRNAELLIADPRPAHC